MGIPAAALAVVRVQLSLAFVAVAFLSVAVVAFWAREIKRLGITEITNGFDPGPATCRAADQPVMVREGFFRAIFFNPPLFCPLAAAVSSRLQSIALVGGRDGRTALPSPVGLVLGPATVTPLRNCIDAVTRVAGGDFRRGRPAEWASSKTSRVRSTPWPTAAGE